MKTRAKKSKQYVPEAHTLDVFERIKNHRPKLSDKELFEILGATRRRRDIYATKLLGALDNSESWNDVQWARRGIKEMDWLADMIVGLAETDK